MPKDMFSQDAVRVCTFAQLMQAESWTLELVHKQPTNLLLWTTRGQGVVNLHGVRRGFSTHNALFVPASHLWAIEIGRQTLGQAVFIPSTASGAFPEQCHLLRVQDGLIQSELTGLIEDMRRELTQNRPYVEEATAAHAHLLAIWLRRQIQSAQPQKKQKAAMRLVRRYCDLLAQSFETGQPMGAYAKALEVTPTHLTRVCRETAGMTAAELLVQCTLHAAREKLVNETSSFKKISESLGFGSAPYFTRFILQHCGATPSDLRKKARKTPL
ncbi:helix-turn-helix domain-containing protein [Cognatishimia sp. WU-CL00825]|uniref:AraC family transcriptional regulator n=1 Tax=Cognatishimia sp. WU-CL00825 TaxID=3127658 RepID=UPI003101C9F0